MERDYERPDQVVQADGAGGTEGSGDFTGASVSVLADDSGDTGAGFACQALSAGGTGASEAHSYLPAGLTKSSGAKETARAHQDCAGLSQAAAGRPGLEDGRRNQRN